jgi:hypothetical protein
MSEIQDEAYSEAMAEIERLKRINVSLVAQERGFREKIERLQFLNKEERETIDELSRLCIRAADALEQFDLATAHLGECPVCRLIAELRKAAE